MIHFIKHFIRKLTVLMILAVFFLSCTKTFAASFNLLTTHDNYSPASQTYCGTAVDIVANWNFINANCGGNPSPNYTITWYYNTTNSVLVPGATQVYQQTGQNASPPAYTLPAANIVVPPAGDTYYYFMTAVRVSGCGPGNPTSQPSTTSTVWNPGANMAYSSSTTTQNTTAVAVNTTNNDIIGIQVLTTGACNPFSATSFTFGTAGTTLLSDVTNAKLFYTGNSSTFATTTQLGATTAPLASFTISGFSQVLAGGTDYFWLSYDIPAGATVGNVADAVCSSFIVNAVSRTPSPTAPTGNRPIVGPPATYCSITGGSSSGTPPYVNNVTMNTLSNLATGQTGSPTYYNDYYPTISTTVNANGIYNLSADAPVAVAGCCYQTTYLQVFIDLNIDGDFSDAGEMVGQANGIGVTGDRVVHLNTTASFWGATGGITRMRVVASTGGYFGPCGTSSDAEIEDYKVYINALASSCSNTVTDGSETTTDCGGSTCGPYATAAMTPASPASAACGSGAYTLTASNAKGSAIQWQQSPDNSNWYNLGGATALTYNGTANTTTYFRAQISGGTCAVFNTPSVLMTITGSTTATWKTTGTTAWGLNTNWSTNVVPTTCTDVTIPSGGTQPTVSATANCRSLTVNSGAQFTVSSTLNIYGNLTNNGNINDAVGSVNLYGTGNTWGGTGTFMNGATQEGNVNIRDGANYALASNQTVDMLHPANTASTGSLAFGSYTMATKSVWYCLFYTYFNTGMMNLMGGGSIDVGKSDYGTGVLWVNSSVNNFGFNLEDDYYSVWFNNSAGTTKFGKAAIDVYVKQDLWIRSPGILDLSASGSNAIVVGHDFINDDVMSAATSFIRMQDFNVAQTQNIRSTNGTVTTFNGLEINNSGTGVYLQINANTNTTATGILRMTKGPLYLNGYKFTVQQGVTAAIERNGTTQTGYVVSETNSATNPSILQWNIAATGAGAHVFPFGTAGGSYIPVTFNNSGSSGNISISTRPTASADNTPWATGVTNMVGMGTNITTVADRWWDITSSVASPLPAVELTLSYLGIENSSTTSPTDTRGVQHWNSTSSCWDDGKNTGCGTVTTSGNAGVTSGVGTVAVTGITYFSPFIVVRAAAPLPIELLSFNAYPVKDIVQLKWETATEINNEYFTIERSLDGKEFEQIGRVKGEGNSSTSKEYNTKDSNPHKGVSYYRLKQTDFDGTSAYSEIVSVNIKEGSNNHLYVYPNPAKNELEVVTWGQSIDITIYDVRGKLVMKEHLSESTSNMPVKLDISGLPAGMYFITSSGESELLRSKFVKE